MSERSRKFVLNLECLVFKGISGKVGPINLRLATRTDHVLTLSYREDGLELIRIIKGIVMPLGGKVIKEDGDMTGCIVKDGCIALVEEGSFFSTKVRDEVSFAAMVGEAKGKLPIKPFIGAVLRASGFSSQLDSYICQLSYSRKRILGLASALLMLPDLLVFLEPLEGLDERQRVLYQDLLVLGKRNVEFATLQIAVNKYNLIPGDVLNGTGIGESLQVLGGAEGL